MRWKLIAWFLVFGALVGNGAAQTSLVEWHEQLVPGTCTFRFPVATGWVVEPRTPAAGAVGLVFRPQSGSAALVLINGTDLKSSPQLVRTPDIKRAVRAMGEARLGESVERKLKLERVEGRAGSGFFYSLTDKRADLPEGEFRHLTQGIIAVGPLRLAVTVNADRADSDAWRTTLELLRTADCAPFDAK